MLMLPCHAYAADATLLIRVATTLFDAIRHAHYAAADAICYDAATC